MVHVVAAVQAGVAAGVGVQHGRGGAAVRRRARAAAAARPHRRPAVRRPRAAGNTLLKYFSKAQ